MPPLFPYLTQRSCQLCLSLEGASRVVREIRVLQPVHAGTGQVTSVMISRAALSLFVETPNLSTWPWGGSLSGGEALTASASPGPLEDRG